MSLCCLICKHPRLQSRFWPLIFCSSTGQGRILIEMIPFIYELKRVISGRTVIILTSVIVLFSLLSVISTVENTSTGGSSINSTQYGYGANDTYHVIVSMNNQYGYPAQGIRVNLTIGNNSAYHKYTDSEGYANFTFTNMTPSQFGVTNGPYSPLLGNNVTYVGLNFSAKEGSYGTSEIGYIPVYLNQSDPYFFHTSSIVGYTNGTADYANNSFGRFVVGVVTSQIQPSRYNLAVTYEGNVDEGAPPVELYYLPYNSTGPNDLGIYRELNSVNESNMTYFGSYSGFTEKIINPGNLTSSNTSQYMFALFTPWGKLIYSEPVTISIPATGSHVNTQFFDSEMTFVGLFIPLMAAASAYLTFGKDKVSGVLESTMVRPVSRKSIILSRYLANTSAVFAAAVASFLISSLAFSFFLGHGLPINTVLTGLYAMLVAIAGFTGIVYFASGIFKSQGAVFAVAVGIFFVLDALWSNLLTPVIPFAIIIGIMRAAPGTIAFARGYILLFYLSGFIYEHCQFPGDG